MVVIEDLHVAGMVKNHCLALSLSDAGLGEFKRQMGYKTAQAGERLVKAHRFFPSSQTCCRCKFRKTDLTLSERLYRCPRCGQRLDRDLNVLQRLAYREFRGKGRAAGAADACGEEKSMPVRAGAPRRSRNRVSSSQIGLLS